MKQCSKCKVYKSVSEFYKDNRHSDGLFSECKPCKNTKVRQTKQTKVGLLRKMYDSQLGNSRGNGKPLYTRKEFINFGLLDHDYNLAYTKWVDSKYSAKLIPTTDRINTLGSYSLTNIRFVSFEDNYKRQAKERKLGIDNRVNKAVYKLDPVSETILEEFYSVAEAARQCNLERANIAKVCHNFDTKVYDTKYQTCGGFKWKFKK